MKGKVIYTSKGEQCLIDGEPVSREEFDRAFPPKAGIPMVSAPSNWHQRAVRNLWVNPVDIPRAIEAARKEGVRVEFKPDGNPVFDSKGEYRAYCEKVRGVFDMDGGYCDPQPTGLNEKALEGRYLEAVEAGQIEPFKQEVIGGPDDE